MKNWKIKDPSGGLVLELNLRDDLTLEQDPSTAPPADPTPDPVPIPPPNPTAMQLGVNLDQIAYFSPQQPFNNLWLQSMPWISQKVGDPRWSDGRTIQTQAGGVLLEPDQIATTLMCRTQAGYQTGLFRVTWEGSGALTVGFDAKNPTSSNANSIHFDLPKATDGGIVLKVTASDRIDPVRNIKCFNTARTGTFNPDFTKSLAPFKTLRFMDWTRTNMDQTWKTGFTGSDELQATPNGVSPDYIVKLCNELDADPWVCIHHLLDDATITAFAQLLDAGLDAGRTIYVEFSNEVWNGMFPASRDIQAMPNSFFHDWASEYKRAMAAFGSGITSGRPVVKVFAGQIHNIGTFTNMIGRLDASDFDALACSPYVSTGLPTVPEMLQYLMTNIQLLAPKVAKVANVAQTAGVPMLAYEGGQHLKRNTNDPVFPQAYQVQTDPGMRDVYVSLLSMCESEGISLFMHFSDISIWNQYGFWGLRNSYVGGPFPKYQAMLDFAQGARL